MAAAGSESTQWSPTAAALALGTLWGLVAMGTSAASVVLGEIQSDLSLGVSTVSLVLTLFSLAYAAGTPAFGRFADSYGPRAPYVLGASLLSLGALASAAAPNEVVLLVARVVQGVGAGSIPVLTNAIISARYGGRERDVALGRVSSAVVVMASLGPLVGGALGSIGGWRVPMALPALALPLITLTYRLAPRSGSGESLDGVGLTLVAMTSGSALLLVQTATQGSLLTLAIALATPTLLVLLRARVRRRPTGYPPAVLVKNRTLRRAAVAAAAMPVVYYSALIVVPLSLAQRGWTPLANGLLLLPGAVIGASISFNSARLLARLGRRDTARLGLTFSCSGALASAALGIHPVFAALGFVAIASGYSLAQPALVGEVSAGVDPEHRGGALGLYNLVFFTGAGLGAAVAGAVGDVLVLQTAMLITAVAPVCGIAILRGLRSAEA